MKRNLRRLVAVSVVLATAMLALAAPVPIADVRVAPEVVAIQLPTGGSAGSSTTLTNHGETPTMITSLVPSGDCTGVTAMPASFRLGSQSEAPANQQALAVNCGWTGFGIRRCQFDANDNSARRAAFSVLCVAGSGSGGLGAMPEQLDFGPVTIGATPAQRTVRITNTSMTSVTGLSVHIDEQGPGSTFGIVNCLGTPGCTLASALLPMGTIDLTITCSPQAIGAIQKNLYLVAGGGQQVLGGIPLSCTGTGTSSGGITVTPTSLTLAQQVTSSVTGSFTVQNTSQTTVYAVQSTTILDAASSQWSVTSSCTLPCALNPQTSLTLMATFTPTAHGPQDATLSISTDDPAATTIDRDLDGTGLGATLELVTDLGTPPSFHVTTRPVDVTGDRAFQIRNGGNVDLTQLTYMITQTGDEFAMVTPPQTVAAGATVDVRVACTPSAAQDFTATLEIRSNGPSSYAGSPRTFELRCTGTSGNLYTEPSAVDFGEVRIAPGQLVMQTVTLRTGASALPISANPALTTNPTGTLSVTAPTAATVSASEPYTTFDVVLDPSVDTPSLATAVSVTTNGTDTIEIPVLGKVVTPAVNVPEQLMIGSFCVGRAPATAEARMTSTGTATINLPTLPYLAAMASSGFALDPGSYPSSLQLNESATVRVRPLGRDTPGTVTDTLVWSTDIEGDNEMPTTSMTAEFIANGGAISPQRVDFGRIELRQPAETTAVRIQNCGAAPLSLGVVTISPTGEFRNQSSEPLPASLAPNAIATVVVGFVPTRTGTRTGTLTISSSEGDLIVTLTGVGLGEDLGDPDKTSFYACDCTTSDPAAAWPALVVVLALRRRRRR